MNACEHGNQGNPDLPIEVSVLADSSKILVRIKDHGGGRSIPDPVIPNLEAKLAGEQSPRGWGLFLIEKMVDKMRTSTDDQYHTIELEMSRRED
jgi:anti-sigma regulatory factor (Ser/Thr protein kinase)